MYSLVKGTLFLAPRLLVADYRRLLLLHSAEEHTSHPDQARGVDVGVPNLEYLLLARC